MPAEARITATPAALEELARLRERHGPLILFQSGGCCEGSSPLCLEKGELLLGPNDQLLGEVGDVPFYIDTELYRRWTEPTFLLDLAAGASDTLSLENRDGIHFVTRTRLSGWARESPRRSDGYGVNCAAKNSTIAS
jgi:uncharacterized protein (DUF779 family)